MYGFITEIQHGSVHDGPGIRSVVFLKGCQMRCFWCHNPETIQRGIQLEFNESLCLHCRRCFSLCPFHTLKNGKHEIARKNCLLCGKCVQTCFSGALSFCGQKISDAEIIKDLIQDIAFYRSSEGGITISGGEPGVQPEFSDAILRECRRYGIHTAIETNLAYSEKILSTLTANCDLIMTDLKHIDPEKHFLGTGCTNRFTIENLQAITLPLILRTPLIYGFNDQPATIRKIAEFAATLPTLQYYELLTYHPLGCEKAKRLGMDCRTTPLPEIPEKILHELINSATDCHVSLRLNGKEITR